MLVPFWNQFYQKHKKREFQRSPKHQIKKTHKMGPKVGGGDLFGSGPCSKPLLTTFAAGMLLDLDFHNFDFVLTPKSMFCGPCIHYFRKLFVVASGCFLGRVHRGVQIVPEKNRASSPLSKNAFWCCLRMILLAEYWGVLQEQLQTPIQG